MSTYRRDDGLLRYNRPPGSVNVVTQTLETATPQERQTLLIDHERLGAHADYHVRLTNANVDWDEDAPDEEHYIGLPGGVRAYGPDEFLQYLKTDPAHLSVLTNIVRSVLFEQFVDDALGSPSHLEP